MTQTAVRAISTRDAVLKTVTVDIRCLTLNGKQVTLSVFRQLQHEDLIDEQTANLTGTPWGRVNYCPTTKCYEEPHIHVVFQKGSELRRSVVLNNPLESQGFKKLSYASKQYAQAYLTLRSLTEGLKFQEQDSHRYHSCLYGWDVWEHKWREDSRIAFSFYKLRNSDTGEQYEVFIPASVHTLAKIGADPSYVPEDDKESATAAMREAVSRDCLLYTSPSPRDS